jgi:hypothetical protein
MNTQTGKGNFEPYKRPLFGKMMKSKLISDV